MINRQQFAPPFSFTTPPSWRCPACREGALSIVGDSRRFEETAESKRDRSHENWEPDWTRQQFSILLRCSRCGEPVFALGQVQPVEDYDDEHGWGLVGAMLPQFFFPPIPIIHVPDGCPDDISNDITHACSLYWASPPSAGNRIRVAVERLMDHLKVKKSRKTKKGKLERLSLHARIELFANKNPKKNPNKNADVGEKLLAIKWLGNTGSHSDTLKHEDVLDAFELFSHALDEIFEETSVRLKKLSSSINRNKGPAPAS